MAAETSALPSSNVEADVEAAEQVSLNIPFPETFVYSNCSAFSISQMDIRISFAEALPDRTAKARAGVVMPPEHAALLAMALIGQVHLYERTFGPIRLPQWQAQTAQAIQRLEEQSQTVDPETQADPKQQ